MKHILVTGGAGFIGSHAIEYFLDKYPHYTIVNLDKLSYAASLNNMKTFEHDPRHVFIKGDILDTDLLENLFKEFNISDVIHFAAESHVDNSIAQPEQFIKTNVMGTFSLLETARKCWKGKNDHRFHHISTDEVYGSLGKEGVFTESSPYAPNSPYSASKASSDHLVRCFFKTYDLNTVITNCSNNYGPHQHAEKFIPTIIRKALAQEPIPIYGHGENVRDWLFVHDHCNAIDKVFHEGQPGSHYNIGGNNEITNIHLAKMICEKLDQIAPAATGKSYKTLIELVKDRPGHDFRYAVSIDKISAQLGWVPTTDFSQGLLQTVQFYASTENATY